LVGYVQYKYTGCGSTSGRAGESLANFIVGQIENVSNSGSICDLGCGNGYLAAKLSERGYSVVGVDASTTGIEVARNSYGQNVEFICAPIREDLKSVLGGRMFDMVLSSEVIEHLYDPESLLRSAADILRPGGIIFISTPYHGYLKNIVIAMLGKSDRHYDPLWTGGHIKFFSPSTMAAILCKAGFESPKYKYWGRIPFLWKSMFCLASLGTGTSVQV